jgi:hypothetical protein
MASTAVHFLFDAIASLVALDESDGLLNFKAAFRSFEPQAEIKNAPILLTLVVCAKVLQVLVGMPSLQPTDHPLSNDRYDMSYYASSALLSLLPALRAPGTPQRTKEVKIWQSVRISSPYYAA